MQLMIKGTLYIFMISDVSDVERGEGYPSLSWNIGQSGKTEIIRWKDKPYFDITVLILYFDFFLQDFMFAWMVLAGLFYFFNRNIKNVILDSEWMNLIKQCFSLFQRGKKCRRESLIFYLTSIILPVNIHSQWICKLQHGGGN